jgi:RHS repeat-associated protein
MLFLSFVIFLFSSFLQAQTNSPTAQVVPGAVPVVILGPDAPPLRVSPARSLPLSPLASTYSSNAGGTPVNILMGFDALHCLEYVDNYYAGGSGSNGTGPGPNFGVTFSSNAEALADRVIQSTCGLTTSNVTNEPSPQNSIIFLSGSAATMNVPAGFTSGFSFYYAAPSYTGFINVWSGLNGTGTLLATLTLPTTGGCTSGAPYCLWNPIGVSFAGTAMSVDFGGSANYIAFDSITLGASIVVNPGKASGNPCNVPGSVSCGDPISIGTGNLYEKVTDYQSAGANKLAFERYYNSLGNLETFANMLGAKWRSTYDRYIRIINASTVTVERADGEAVNFNLNGSAWTPDSDVDLSLVQSGASWTLTDKEGTVETYSAINSNEALLNSIRARNGYTQTLAYNSSNLLASVTDSYNRSLGFTYQYNLLQTVTTPDSLTLSYSYAARGTGTVLTSVAYSTSPVTSQTYLYESTLLPYALTGITDENNNRFANWTYDSTGRALTSQHANGADLMSVTYNDTDNSRTVTNAFGVSDTYTFTTLQGVPKITQVSRAATSSTVAATETLTYDSNGYVASKIDWNGNQTTYVNNSHGLPTTINEAVGTGVARTITIAYDSTWVHLPATVTTPGLTISFTYDSNGEVLTKTLKDTTTTSVPYSTSGQTRTWTNTWSNALLASSKTPNGNTTKYTYDSSGALTSTTDAKGHVTNITAHTGGGLPLTIVDPNSVTTTLTYGPRLWLTSSTVSGSSGTYKTAWAYDAAGNLIQTTLPDNSYISNTLDTAHRLIKVTDALGNYTSYTLDALGDRTQTNIYTKGGSTAAFQRADTFDALGRLLVDTQGAGQTTTKTYDLNGNVITVADGLGHTTTNTYDALNRLAASTDANSGTTTPSYDAHDRIINVKDANGNATAYIRDGFGDVIQQTSPDSGVSVFRYDADANVTKKTDALSIVTNQTFDSLDRVLTTTYPASTAENVAYTYDQTGTGFSFGIGRLTSVTDAAGSLTRAYEERGNLFTETRVNGTKTLVTGYTYDGANRVASMAYPDGTLVNYQYDAAGYVSTVTAKPVGANSTTTIATIHHQPFGPMNAVIYGNGIAESWSYDNSYRATSITDTLSSATVQKLTYAYDSVNNVKSITDAVNAADGQTLTYDPTNRLIGAASGTGGYGTFSWTYDKVGNRLTQVQGSTTTTYTYATGSNRLATYTITKATAMLEQAPSFKPANGNGPALWAHVPPSGPIWSFTTNQPDTKNSSSTMLATILGWPLLLVGLAGVVRFRKHLHDNKYFVALFLVAILTGVGTLLNGCGGSGGGSTTPPQTPQAAAPTFTPASGTYTSAQTITISDSTAGAMIYYTTDGSSPTTSSTKYTASISVTTSETIKAIATASGYANSAIASAIYTMNIPLVVTVSTNANGNITSIPPANASANATFTYDNANRLASVTGAPLAATFAYDWEGKRISKSNPGAAGPILYSYANGGTLIAENDNGTLTDYIYADGRPIAVLHPGASPIANQVNYIVADRVGTPQLAGNSNGTTVWSTAYQAFGTTGNVSAAITQNLRFPGQFSDVETGFNYNLNRDYMPNVGRYLQADPIGMNGGANSYLYVSGNPMVTIDPLGISGLLTIYSSGTTGLGIHSWISYTPDPLPYACTAGTTTYGTWGNNPNGLGNGLHENLETNYSYSASRSEHLDDAQQAQLMNLIQQYRNAGGDAWELLAPCSTFAAASWAAATGESLNTRSGIIPSDPTALTQSIIDANGGFNTGVVRTSGESCVEGSPYSDGI